MSKLSYDAADVRVRDDLVEAHRGAFAHIARPGCWFTGEQRVAIAAETRNAAACALCRERKAALSPNAIEGDHSSLGELTAPVIDAIHRVVTDPGRLSRRWFDQLLERGLTEGEYVELVGVMVKTVTVDTFCRALGVSLHALPRPEDGEPSGYRPAGAKDHGAWVPMLAPLDARGPEVDLYPSMQAPNVIRALSLVPDEVRALFPLANAMYVPPDQLLGVSSERAISRAQIELIATKVSALGECFY